MDLKSFYAQLDADPDFQRLTYAEQKELKSKAALKALSSDSDFLGLPGADQQSVLKRLTTVSPAFENPMFSVIADIPALAEDAKKGGHSIARSAMRGWSFMNEYSSAKVLTGGINAVLQPILKAISPDPALQEASSPDKIMWGPDTLKAADYLSDLMGKPGGRELMSTVGQFTDYASYMIAGRGPSALIGKAAAGLAANVGSQAARFLISGAAPAVLRTAGGAAVNAAREVIQNATEGEQTTGKQALDAAAQGALLDFSTNMFAASLPYFKANLWIFGKGVQTSSLKDIGGSNFPKPAELARYVQKIAAGAAPEEVMSGLHPAIREEVTGAIEYEYLKALKPSEFAADPLNASKYAAWNSDMVLTDLPDGRTRLRVRHGVQPGDWGRSGETVVGEFDNVVDLNRALAEESTKIEASTQTALRNAEAHLSKMGPEAEGFREAQAAVDSLKSNLARHQLATDFLQPYKKLPVQIDSTFGEPTAGSDAKPLRSRGVMSQGELSDELSALRQKGTVAMQTQIVPTAAQKNTMRRAGRLFETDAAVRLPAYEGPDGNALVLLTNPADELKVLKAAEDMKKIGVVDAAGQQDYLIQAGYDGILHADGSATSFFPRSQVKFVSDFVNPKTGKLGQLPQNAVLRKVQRVGTAVNSRIVTGDIPVEGKRAPGIRDPRAVEQFGKTNFIRQKITAFVPDHVLRDSDTAMARVLSTVSGDMDEHSAKVRKVVSLLMDRANLPKKSVRIQTLEMDDAEKVFVRQTADGLSVSIPKKINGPAEQAAFTKGLLAELNRFAKENAGYTISAKEAPGLFSMTGAVPMGLPVQGKIREQLAHVEKFLPPVQDPKAAREWFSAMVKREWGAAFEEIQTPQGVSYMVKSSGKQPFQYTYESFEDAVDDTLIRQMKVGQLRSDLADQGFRLVQKEKGLVVLDGSRVVASGADVPEILQKMNYRPTRIDGRLAPQDIRVVEGGVEFAISGDTASGKLKNLRRFLDRFVNSGDAEMQRVLARSALGKISQRSTSIYEVVIPSFGIRQTFGSAAEARAFVSGKWADAEFLVRTAADRGYDLTRRGGKWVLQSEEGTRTVAELDDIGKILKDSPDPAFAPEIAPELNVDADIEWADAHLSTKPTFFVPDGGDRVPTTDIGVFGSAGAALRPQQRWLAEKLTQSGRTDIADLFQSLQTHATEMRRVQNGVREPIIQLFKEADGKKIIPKKRREGILQYMEAAYRNADSVLRGKIRRDFGLTLHDIEVSEAARSILGTAPTEGLHAAFGISGQKWLFDYMPRYRSWASGKIDDVNSMVGLDPVDVWKSKISGEGNVPKEVDFMSAYKRTNDVVDFSRETDALKVMLRYTDTGFKSKYLDPVWRDLDAAMKVGPLNETLKIQLNRYREVLMGSYQTTGEKILANFGEALHKKLGMNAEVGRKMMDAYFTVNVLTTQAARPWLAVRNVAQTWTTLGALMGVDYTQQAVKTVMEDPERWIGLLQKYGIVTEAPPLIHDLIRAEGEAASLFGKVAQGAENLAGKAAQKGMWAVKNGDDLTRAFAYVAARLRFDEAAVKLQKGIFKDYASFAEYAAVNYMDEPVQKLIEQQVKAGQFDQARHVFGVNVTDLTMYSYAKQNRPKIMDGVIGRMFGQYQVYPFNYVELIRRMGSKGTVAQKAATLGRLAGIAAGIAAGLTAVGMEGSNFLPWMPASMSGGPLFGIAVNVAQATNFAGYQGRQARAELGSMLPVQMNLADWLAGKGDLDPKIEWPRTVPGYYQVKAFWDAKTYAEKGESWKAFLSLTGAPIRMDLR